MNVWKKLKLSITIGRWVMDQVNKKLESYQRMLKRSKYRLRSDLVKLIKRTQLKDNTTLEVVPINKLYWIIIVWRYSSKISNKIVKINKEKTTKPKREAQPKTQVKVLSNISSKITSSNSNTSKVTKFQDLAPIKQLKKRTKPPLIPQAIKITVARIPITTTKL